MTAIDPRDEKHVPAVRTLYYCGYCRRQLMPLLNANNEVTDYFHMRRKVKAPK